MTFPNQTRNINVDTLRFLCALGVVTQHATGLLITENNFIWPIIRYTCVYSVYIFFIISGYAISESLKLYKPSLFNAIKYIIRRSVRLDAPYWLMLTIYFILETLLKQRNYGLVDLLANAVYLQRIFGFTQVIGVAWTLCIEVQFYLLLLLINSYWKTSTHVASIYACLIAGTIVAKYTLGLFSDDNLVFQYLPWFTVGIIASWQKVTANRFSILSVAGVLTSQCVLDGRDYRDIICTSVYGAGAYLLITNVELTRSSTKLHNLILRTPKFVKIASLGSYTYSVYLTHMLAIKAVSNIGFLPNAFAKISMAFMLTAIMAYMLNHLIEKPALLLSRKISYHY